MNPDYTKSSFNENEKELMNKQSEIIRFKFPEKIPILIRIKSHHLKTEKYKFLIPNDLSLTETINGITSRLLHIDGHTLIFKISSLNETNTDIDITKTITNMSLVDIYNMYKDLETDVLILSVRRQTFFKWSKSFIF
jgi:hypothetical protein